MDKFLGKYESVPEMTEGLDAYCDAMKIPEAARETMRKPMTNETFKEGDHYKEVNCYADGRKEEFVFKLDEPFTTNVMGMEAKNVFKLDGEAIKGEHEMFGLVTTTVKYLKDGLGVFESSGNGATMKTYWKKV